MPVNYEVKGQLAKLLATEDLIIENKNVTTASFDVHRRVLVLPMWQKASDLVYDLLVGHEVGHALYTPDIIWTEDYPEVPPSFVNVIEDARVERHMKKKFPGLAKTFYRGYNELNEEDFFGIGDDDISSYSFIDRININNKIGNFLKVEFSEEEQIYVNRCAETQSFDDVLELSRDIVEFLASKQDSKESIEQPNQSSSEPSSVPQAGGSQTDETSESENQFEDSGESSGGNSESDGSGIKSKSETGGSSKKDEMESKTADTFDQKIDDLNTPSSSPYTSTDNVYIEIPKVNLDSVVIKNSEVHHYLSEFYRETQSKCDYVDFFESVDSEFKKFKISSQKEVNYLVKEFECRKAADSYARATTSRTGTLDMNALHTFKWNEDIFKKVTTISDGKNHGLIFVLDWSGSMSEVLSDTYKQLLSLMWFCKKCSIPFVVYAFTHEWNYSSVQYQYDPTLDRKVPVYPTPHHEKESGKVVVYEEFSLLTLFDSSVRSSEFEKQVKNIWRLVSSLSSNRYNCHYQYPNKLGLSGTPLNEALICLNQIIPQFKARTKAQKIQCVVLTDGEAPTIRYYQEVPIKNKFEDKIEYNIRVRSLGPYNTLYLRDRDTKHTYKIEPEMESCTKAFLCQLQDKFEDVNFIGIRIIQSREASNFIRKHSSWDYNVYDKLIETWKKTKTIMLHDTGYNVYFGLSSNSLNADSEFDVQECATKSQIRSAFKKSLGAKKTNKKILTEFVKLIA